MANKNLLSDKDRELIELVEQFEAAQAEQKPIYMDAEDLADIAEWYSRRNRFDDAAKAIDHGLKLHPGNTSLLVEQVYLYLDQYDLLHAQQTARLLTEERPDVIILRARLLVEEGRLQDAELMLDTLEDKYSRENLIDVAYMYLEAGQRQCALDWLSHWHWNTDDQEYCAIMADSLLDQQKYQESLVYYNRLIDSKPYQPQYWIGAARCHLGMRQYEKAIDSCDYALLADEDMGEAYLIKGYAFLELNNSDKAFECYNEAVRCKAITNAYVHLLRGQYHVDRQEWQKAYHYLLLSQKEENTLKDPIARSNLHSTIAVCLKKINKEENKQLIMQHCLKALDNDYCNVDAQLIGGLIFIEEGEKKTGLNMWKEISELVPEAHTWSEISLYSCEAFMFDYAIEALKKVEELDPDYPGLYKRFVVTCLLAGKDKEALHYNNINPTPLSQKEMFIITSFVQDATPEELQVLMEEYLKLMAPKRYI